MISCKAVGIVKMPTATKLPVRCYRYWFANCLMRLNTSLMDAFR